MASLSPNRPCPLMLLLLPSLKLSGNGGDCKKYGPGNLCRDQPFTGYTCAKSLTCERQNNYYWQCVSPDRNNIQTNSNKPSATSSTSSNTNKPSSAADKVLKEGVQCGGKGAKCQDYGACVDGLFPGYTCDKGLTCNRQNEWYHQVSLARREFVKDNPQKGPLDSQS